MRGNGDFSDQFGANLKGLRKAAGLSQEELGFRADLHRTEVGMLECGVRLPRIDTMIKLCGSLPCRPDQLLAGLDWIPREATSGGFDIGDSADEPEAYEPQDDDPVDGP